MGHGYGRSPDSHNRVIREATGILAWQVLPRTDRGAMQVATQASRLSRSPWWRGSAPSSADALMLFVQLRDDLP